ncbi:hypothetical protein E1161_03965 [Saccharopolyspora aridisoli]|uniref:Uncharacterized protein n=1 Tax=Saccharopolyspora aridisoli TaxID=2530385 RepID=A0A4R4UUX8_9PSEU|nr:hypothetical protein [Saccharopolyspora aridisoli]TDC95931.1 hypothetical protein E1161_03965 [Saccharopolyspora aridisoli]
MGEQVLLIVECLSRSSRRTDYIDEPAEHGKVDIPHSTRVDVSYERARVELLELVGGEYRDHPRAHRSALPRTDLPSPDARSRGTPLS